MSNGDDPKNRSVEENRAEYNANMHSIQSAVAFEMSRGDTAYGDHKHMQVGIISSMVTDHAVATLLIEKGIFTVEEYAAQLVLSTRQELDTMTARANERFGRDVLRFR